ncbi:MAG: CDP-diacylglycerol--serine O-phosphatidyltransferase [Epsilonproteobacteria bacterium]|nr:CDP-diacylglycerol--serine O-phosphatidyltransferase [Campylobacterota bacterium]
MQKIKFAYILPNLFTAASIFTGVVSIVKASQGKFESAAWLIFLSLIFDGLDGRVARLTHTTSKFGVEFDSLADIVAFGVAPAFLVYFYCGYSYGKFGILVAALFIILGAIRLARFNITTSQNDPNFFIGLPIPSAAIYIATLTLFFLEYDLEYKIILPILSLVVAILMVSNIRYPSFKKISIERRFSLEILVTLTIIISFLYIYPTEGLLIILSSYILYGAIRALINLNKKEIKKA